MSKCNSWVTRSLVVALFIGGISSCKTKSGARDASAVLLEHGTGVIMVVFPKPAYFERSEWMAQVDLRGVNTTATLPRMPLADSQTLLVMNVPPGTYSGTAVSFLRNMPPTFGGSFDSVRVVAGEITIMHGKNISQDRYPFGNTPIKPTGKAIWSLKSADLLQSFIAQIASHSARG